MRIKIEEPEKYLFAAQIRTRITDLNYGAHVGNDRIFGFMHDARVQWLKSLGYDNELAFGGEGEKIGTIQTDAAITYKAEIFEHENITISLACTDFNNYGCDFIYRFEKEDGSLAALGKTGIVFFDYIKRSLVSMPEDFTAKVKK